MSLWGKERVLEDTDYIYSYDSHVIVKAGTAILWEWVYNASIDKWGEVGYTAGSGSEKTFLQLNKGRLWLEPKKTVTLKMKNINAEIKDGDIVLGEQQSQVYSILYVLSWSIDIDAGSRTYKLDAGRRIMVSQSDLASSSTTLESLAGQIDAGIKQNAFFLSHNGETLLSNIKDSPTLSGSSNSGWIIPSSWSGGSIEMIYPTDGAMVPGKIELSGKLIGKNVKKVTVNGIEASLSQVDESFKIKDFAISSDTTDLVYKAYDPSGNMLERWVITVYSKSPTSPTDKLVPTTFSTGDKNFRITSPLENPYRTSERAVTVSGIVPKNTVEYITVNGYKLKKFTPNGTSWYYYANRDYDTMEEGFNLYEIKFYWPNNTLISSQAFTIIKEGSSTVSWE